MHFQSERCMTLVPAPDELIGIGVLGTGVQARLQVALLKNLYPHCNKLTVWGHTKANAVRYAKEMTENEIMETFKAFGAVAKRAVKAGADAIQLHGAHR